MALFPCFVFVSRPKDLNAIRTGCVQDTEYCCTWYRILLFNRILYSTGYRIQDTGTPVRRNLEYPRNSVTFHGSSILACECLCLTPISHHHLIIINNLVLALNRTSAASVSEVSLVGWYLLTRRVGWSHLRSLYMEREGVHLSTLLSYYIISFRSRTDCLAFCSMFPWIQDAAVMRSNI